METKSVFVENIIRIFFKNSAEDRKEEVRTHLGMMKYILLMLLVVTLAYSNHFKNEFHFDDTHTICNNVFIRDIGNIPRFFKDVTTGSSLPANQAYRPMTTTTLAIDYWIGQKMSGDGFNSTFYFHLSTFLWYLLQLVLMYFIFYKIFNLAHKHRWNRYFALFGAMWYGVLTSNAETINYIISRTDSLSTVAVIIGFAMYMYSARSRKYYLYLIPIIFGMFVKEPAMIFAPLLFFYILFFEKKMSIGELFNSKNRSSLTSTIIRVLPVVAICVALVYFIIHMLPPLWTGGGVDRLTYLQTQTFVIVHYFLTFFLPTGLSADTDWTPIRNIFDDRVIVGTAFLIGMAYVIIRTSKDARTRPISFGLIWFLLALAPTSSFMPLAEVLNDHRIFFPFVGLMLAVTWSIALFLTGKEHKIMQSSNTRAAVLMLGGVLIAAHSYGTYQRNKVWKTEDGLWYDVTIKSPQNGRGLMNYGLAKMRVGEYQEALSYFNRALVYVPNYSYLQTNLGILKNAMGNKAEAEGHFRKSIELDSNNPESYYFFGNYLKNCGRNQEALEMAQRALQLAPGHISAQNLMNQLLASPGGLQSPLESAENLVKSNPTPEAYLNLSLQYYNARRYEDCIKMCEKALELRPKWDAAYNNICCSYNELHKWNEAIQACETGLKFNPEHRQLKGNLEVSKKGLKGV